MSIVWQADRQTCNTHLPGGCHRRMNPQAATLQLQHSHSDHCGDIAAAQRLLLLKQPQPSLVYLNHVRETCTQDCGWGPAISLGLLLHHCQTFCRSQAAQTDLHCLDAFCGQAVWQVSSCCNALSSDACKLTHLHHGSEGFYLFADCPPLEEGPQRKGKACDANVEAVEERHFIRLNLSYTLSY